jgi:hypothetical protein
MKFLMTLLMCLPLLAFSSEKKKVDIMLVVDNSGSMFRIHEKVKKDIKHFFKVLNNVDEIDWRLTMISTDINDAPYLHLYSPNTKGGDSEKAALKIFSDAVDLLGTDGNPYEKSFDSLAKALLVNTRGQYARKNADFVTIFVSDEPEGSALYKNTERIMKFLRMSYPVPQKITAYGMFNLIDLYGCIPNNPGKYTGSEFEKIINTTQGFAISMCTHHFISDITRLAHDIVQKTLAN